MAKDTTHLETAMAPFTLLKKRLLWLRSAGLRDFPWVIFIKFSSVATVSMALILLTAEFILRDSIGSLDRSRPEMQRAVDLFDQTLIWTLIAGFFVVFLFNAWLWFTAYRPLGRLRSLVKRGGRRTRRSRNLQSMLYSETKSSTEDDDFEFDAFEENSAEWNDLEKAILRLEERTEARETEAKIERDHLETVLGALNTAIVAFDSEFRPKYYNARYEVLFGSGFLQRAGSNHSLIERFRIPEFQRALTEAVRENKMRTFHLKIATQLQNSEKEFQVSISPVQFSHFKLASDVLDEKKPRSGGGVAIFYETSELKRVEQIKVDFVANASHELRTPLTAIVGFVAAARESLKENRLGDVDKNLEVSSRNITRMKELLEDLLELSHLESGREIKKEMISLKELAQSVLANERIRQFGAAGINRIRFDFKTDTVYADFQKIELVLLNLIENGLKYSGNSAVQVSSELKGKDVELKVADSGVGIAEEHLPRIFERFFRVDSGRSRDVGGTGLGLAIVKHIVLAHGGTISVKSQPDLGVQFLCRFPEISEKQT